MANVPKIYISPVDRVWSGFPEVPHSADGSKLEVTNTSTKHKKGSKKSNARSQDKSTAKANAAVDMPRLMINEHPRTFSDVTQLPQKTSKHVTQNLAHNGGLMKLGRR